MTWSYITLHEEADMQSILRNEYVVACAVISDGHEFAYDANGRVTTYTDFDGAELGYTYDALGRPTSMSAYEQGNNYSYAYNAAGQLATITAPVLILGTPYLIIPVSGINAS